MITSRETVDGDLPALAVFGWWLAAKPRTIFRAEGHGMAVGMLLSLSSESRSLYARLGFAPRTN